MPPGFYGLTAPAALISTRQIYDELASIYLPIAIGVFALFTLLIVFFAIRGRFRAEPSDGAENNPLEGSYAVLLVCVVAFLLYLTLTREHRVDSVASHERPSLVVNVIAAKWEWEFSYPAQRITARSGFVGDQPLVVPANRAIRFNLSSQDVIHSLWIPQLEFKRDLIPGRTQQVTLTFTHAGTFAGQCAEFCGLHHAEMTFRVRVMPPAQFASWAAAHRGKAT